MREDSLIVYEDGTYYHLYSDCPTIKGNVLYRGTYANALFKLLPCKECNKREEGELKISGDLWRYTDEEETTIRMERIDNTVNVYVGNQYTGQEIKLDAEKAKELKDALEKMILLIEPHNSDK